jgi:hypothetical protein
MRVPQKIGPRALYDDMQNYTDSVSKMSDLVPDLVPDLLARIPDQIYGSQPSETIRIDCLLFQCYVSLMSCIITNRIV